MKKIIILSTLVMFIGIVGMVYAVGQLDIYYSPITISQPGSYILVSDLHNPMNTNCITIQTSNVTIDLNGHTLYGSGTSSGFGIYSWTGYRNITISNGIVRDFAEDGIYLQDRNCAVINVKAIHNSGSGIWLHNNSIMKDNIVDGNGNTGLIGITGCIMTGNAANDNGGYGIYGGTGCTLTGNSASGNHIDGIEALNGTSVISNSSYNNYRFGINASMGCTIKENTLYENSSSGLYVYAGCQVINNTARSNNSAGIEAGGTDNFIGQNLCNINGSYGLRSGTGNYFEQNKLSGNGTNESLGGSTEGAGDLANVIF